MNKQEIFIENIVQLNKKIEQCMRYLLKNGIYPMEEDGTYSELSCRYSPTNAELVFHNGGQGIRAIYGLDGNLIDIKYNPKVYEGRRGPCFMPLEKLYKEGYEVKEAFYPLMKFFDKTFEDKLFYYNLLKYTKENNKISVYYDEEDKAVYIGTAKEKVRFAENPKILYADVDKGYEEEILNPLRLNQLIEDNGLLSIIKDILKTIKEKEKENDETGIQRQDWSGTQKETR